MKDPKILGKQTGFVQIEYFILIVVVLSIAAYFLSPGGLFKTRLDRVHNLALDGMVNTVDAIANGLFSR